MWIRDREGGTDPTSPDRVYPEPAVAGSRVGVCCLWEPDKTCSGQRWKPRGQ
jgi:hypothetical protein